MRLCDISSLNLELCIVSEECLLVLANVYIFLYFNNLHIVTNT